MERKASAPLMTEQEYLAFERASDIKHEFFEGELFAMAGGTMEHSLIATNCTRRLANLLVPKGCTVYNSDLRVKVEATGLLIYPDASAVCGPLSIVDRDTLLNPALILEVLSPSTEGYDRGVKFHHYRRIPSLTTYLL